MRGRLKILGYALLVIGMIFGVAGGIGIKIRHDLACGGVQASIAGPAQTAVR